MCADEADRLVESLLFEETGYMDHYKKQLYQARFEQLEQEVQPLLAHMQTLEQEDADRYAVQAKAWAVLLVESVKRKAAEQGVAERRRAYREWMDGKRAVMALYVLPLFEKQRRDYADLFREELFVLWNASFPSHPVMKASYEEIIQGFQKRGFGCYITSAVCRAMNRPDDCYELSAFRGFRDGYLSAQPDGMALIREYYETAPRIVAAIDAREDAEQIYCRIWDMYLLPCLKEIETGMYESCKNRYVEMVQSLQERFADMHCDEKQSCHEIGWQ